MAQTSPIDPDRDQARGDDESNATSVVTTVGSNIQRSEGEQYLFDRLNAALNAGHLPAWTLYEQPHLNGDRPDFVLMHPERGIILIEVKDWRLARDEPQRPSAIEQLERLHKNILQLYARTYLPLEEAHGNSAYAVVTSALYFHNARPDVARSYLRHSTAPKSRRALEHVVLLGRDEADAIARGELTKTPLQPLRRTSSKFSAEGLLADLVEDLDAQMRPSDYDLGRTAAIALDADQQRQADPAPGIHRRLKGVAGAGKTLVLASRAARLLAEGRRVLVLTYNITLQHFVRDLVHQQYQGVNSGPLVNSLVVHHFHGFLKFVAEKHNIVLSELPTGTTAEARRERSDMLERGWVAELVTGLTVPGASSHPDCVFDAILIDEGQDFRRDWVELALRLLSPHDEFLITFDALQNIYERELVWLDSGGDVAGLGFSGPPARLNKSHRLPDVMAIAANDFARAFLGGGSAPERGGVERPTIAQTGLFDPIMHRLAWMNIPNAAPEDIVDHVLDEIDFARDQLSAQPNDIAILLESEPLALPIIEELKHMGLGVTHIFDDRGGFDEHIARNAYRRQLKWRFQPSDGRIKLCTIHSFKGWESPYIIGVLGAPRAPQAGLREAIDRAKAALVYIALTRLRRTNDGSSSMCSFINTDPQFDQGRAILERANGGQVGGSIVARHDQGQATAT